MVLTAQFVTFFCLLDLGHGQDGWGDDKNVWIRYVVLRMQYWKQAKDRSRTSTGGIEPSGENESVAHARLLQRCCVIEVHSEIPLEISNSTPC